MQEHFGKSFQIIKLNHLFTAPTAFRAIKKEDPEGKFFSKYDLSNFEFIRLQVKELIQIQLSGQKIY